MDSFLIDYLKSGRAWVLVGSGPSIVMGYPSWQELAQFAIETLKSERLGCGLGSLQSAMKRNDFPKVFEEVKNILGGPNLLQALKSKFPPSKESDLYRLIAKWPVPVYLTTNYDDEIQNHLSGMGEAYISYSNSEDHFSHLLPNLNGAIVKLHGDLRSETGLILTTKKGAGVLQPICWIAPDVKDAQIKEYLEKYRIRVISYDNRDGEHKNLIRLIEHISEFVPPRTTVRIQTNIAKLSKTPLGSNAATPGFFVFNKLFGQSDYEKKREDVIISAIQSALPVLTSKSQFTLEEALEVVGWPKGSPLSSELAKKILA